MKCAYLMACITIPTRKMKKILLFLALLLPMCMLAQSTAKTDTAKITKVLKMSKLKKAKKKAKKTANAKQTITIKNGGVMPEGAKPQ